MDIEKEGKVKSLFHSTPKPYSSEQVLRKCRDDGLDSERECGEFRYRTDERTEIKCYKNINFKLMHTPLPPPLGHCEAVPHECSGLGCSSQCQSVAGVR